MNVLIEEIGSNNKGAYLMFLAVKEKIEHQYKNNKIVVDDGYFSRVEEAEHNLYRFAHFQRVKIKIHNFINSAQLARYHLVKTEDVNLVLNAGGYANGDFWYENFGEKGFNRKLLRYRNLKKKGIPIILLPQAFDKFTSSFIKQYIIEVHNLVDLIYARDQVSLENLHNVIGISEKIKLAPDFTNLIEAPSNNLIKGDYVTIIPNSKMIEAGIITRDTYIESLCIMASTVHARGVNVVFLNHEGKADEELILEVQNRINFENLMLTNLTALEVKSVIKDSLLLITGRFHGLVSALSQEVPVLATSWSHKYKELLSDYDVEGQLVDINNKEELLSKISQNLDYKHIQSLKILLKKNSAIQKIKAEDMWQEIFEKIKN